MLLVLRQVANDQGTAAAYMGTTSNGTDTGAFTAGMQHFVKSDPAWLYALQAAKTSITVWGIWLGHVYHWHIELMPRVTRVAGFEWGTGFYINPTPPEEAARVLRAVRL